MITSQKNNKIKQFTRYSIASYVSLSGMTPVSHSKYHKNQIAHRKKTFTQVS